MNRSCLTSAIAASIPAIAIVMTLCLCVGCKASGSAGRSPCPAKSEAVPGAADGAVPDDAPPRPARRWHVDVGLRNSYPRLDSAHHQLDRRLNLPLKLDVAGVFDEPYTPLDRRSDFRMTSWYTGIGRQESPHFVWTCYVGGGSAKDLNHQRFLIETLEVDFEYAYAYTGIMAEYYPWEVPAAPPAFSLKNTFRSSRPFLHAGLESGYVSAEGEGDFKIAGLNVYHDEQRNRDWLFSIAIGMGWAFPLDDRWSFTLSGDYRYQFYRPEEYSGWNFTTGIRYRF